MANYQNDKNGNNQADFWLHNGASTGVVGETSYKPQLILINSLRSKTGAVPW